MSTKHLGERVHDLLDNRLSRAETVAAMEHLDECAECVERWQELRSAREALNSSEAGIDVRFAQQLLDRERMAQIAREETPARARAAAGPGRKHLTMVAAAVGAMFVGVTAAYVAGAPQELSLEFAASSMSGNNQSVSFHDSDSMRQGDQLRSWVHPDWDETGLVPIEAKVVQRASGANVLVATLLSDMEPIVVTEQHGQLAADVVRDMPRADVETATAYVVSEDPARIIWQAGDVVISATCECALVTLCEVAEAFPTDDDPGFVDRISAGVGEFADILTGD
ncbi:MAG: zf-HC2 domain-containing protein [Demequina sp.]